MTALVMIREPIMFRSTCILLIFVQLNLVGGITVSDTIIRENTGSNEFTLTCISTGGPATTVTWTRGSETAVGERTTVFDTTTANTTAQYTHTLTGSTAGVYTCTVANDKPAEDSASIIVEGIYMYVLFVFFTTVKVESFSNVLFSVTLVGRSSTYHKSLPKFLSKIHLYMYMMVRTHIVVQLPQKL